MSDEEAMAVDVIELDLRVGQRVIELIAGSANHGGAPTPCAGWTVEDLVAHMIAGNMKHEGIARGDDFVPGAPAVSVGDDPAAAYQQTFAAHMHPVAWTLHFPGRRDGSLLIKEGVPVKVVSERLGHAHIAHTMQTYQHVLPGVQADAGLVAQCLAKPFARAKRRRWNVGGTAGGRPPDPGGTPEQRRRRRSMTWAFITSLVAG